MKFWFFFDFWRHSNIISHHSLWYYYVVNVTHVRAKGLNGRLWTGNSSMTSEIVWWCHSPLDDIIDMPSLSNRKFVSTVSINTIILCLPNEIPVTVFHCDFKSTRNWEKTRKNKDRSKRKEDREKKGKWKKYIFRIRTIASCWDSRFESSSLIDEATGATRKGGRAKYTR